MIKKIMLLLCALLVTTTCYAYQDTINGFRGIPWGTSMEEVKSSGVFNKLMEPKGELPDGSVMYETEFIEPKLLGVPLEYAILGFKNGKFDSITIFYKENSTLDSYHKLSSRAFRIWGRPFDHNEYFREESSLWREKDALIHINSWRDSITDEYFGSIYIAVTKK